MLGRFAPQAFALLRIMSGVMFFLHGTQKLLGWPPMPKMPGGGGLPTIAIVAGVLELVLGAAITLGLFGDWAAFLASGEMAVAFFMGHVARSHDIVPLTNQGEDAVLYCFIFLFIAAHGSGIWSIDSVIRRGRGRVSA